jgi:hypothetical protein
MNRREALLTMGATFATFVLPSPRKRIDLMAFCAQEEHHKYDMRLPYELQDWTYATDSRVCVRVRPQSGDVAQHKDKIPPFNSLSWNHDALRVKWSPLRKLDPIPATDSECPTCNGYGHVPSTVPAHECHECDGMGHTWIGNGWDISVPVKCRACKGRGYTIPPGAVTCPNCNGNAIGVFPGLVEIDGRYFDSRQYAKVQTLDGEFVHDSWNGICRYPMLKFRFDGGHGLLIGVETPSAKKRIKEARHGCPDNEHGSSAR